jgi:hypothetical protein
MISSAGKKIEFPCSLRQGYGLGGSAMCRPARKVFPERKSAQGSVVKITTSDKVGLEKSNTMGYSKSKTIQRDEISGLFQHNDVQDGTHSVNELQARSDARQAAINAAHKKDWTDDPNSVNSPSYGNSMSRQPKPSDAVAGSGDRYGKEDQAPPVKGGAIQKDQLPTVKGIMPASKGRG